MSKCGWCDVGDRYESPECASSPTPADLRSPGRGRRRIAPVIGLVTALGQSQDDDVPAGTVSASTAIRVNPPETHRAANCAPRRARSAANARSALVSSPAPGPGVPPHRAPRGFAGRTARARGRPDRKVVACASPTGMVRNTKATASVRAMPGTLGSLASTEAFRCAVIAALVSVPLALFGPPGGDAPAHLYRTFLVEQASSCGTTTGTAATTRWPRTASSTTSLRPCSWTSRSRSPPRSSPRPCSRRSPSASGRRAVWPAQRSSCAGGRADLHRHVHIRALGLAALPGFDPRPAARRTWLALLAAALCGASARWPTSSSASRSQRSASRARCGRESGGRRRRPGRARRPPGDRHLALSARRRLPIPPVRARRRPGGGGARSRAGVSSGTRSKPSHSSSCCGGGERGGLPGPLADRRERNAPARRRLRARPSGRSTRALSVPSGSRLPRWPLPSATPSFPTSPSSRTAPTGGRRARRTGRGLDLRANSGPDYRVEVVPTADHWEAYWVP